MSDEGNFSFSATLAEGENKFLLRAVDKAGNTSEKNLTLKYSP